MPSMRNAQTVTINNAATGQTTIFKNPSATGFAYVWDMYVTVAGATNLVFYNGSGALTGNMNFLAGGIFDQSGLGNLPMWTIDPNSNLSVTSTAAAQQSGWLTYSN
jgi:hypothetical protein